jgi:hypothetical protein
MQLLNAGGLRPQQQAFKHLSDFVYNNDGPTNLLIVYYAGHGGPGSQANDSGEITLGPTMQLDGDQRAGCTIEWVEVERVLRPTQADALVVFDCCHAGLRAKQTWCGGAKRSYQFLGACEALQQTRWAGPYSFTTAMVWALQKLARKSGYPVSELVNTLSRYRNFPRDQTPVLWNSRFEPAASDIWLAPTPAARINRLFMLQDDDSDDDESAPDYSSDYSPVPVLPTYDYLDIRFHFGFCEGPTEIRETAQAMTRLVNQKYVPFHKASFLKHSTVAERTADVVAAVEDAVINDDAMRNDALFHLRKAVDSLFVAWRP